MVNVGECVGQLSVCNPKKCLRSNHSIYRCCVHKKKHASIVEIFTKKGDFLGTKLHYKLTKSFKQG